jgi:hypothetical protein
MTRLESMLAIGLAAGAALLQGCVSPVAVNGSEGWPQAIRASGVALKPAQASAEQQSTGKATAAVLEQLAARGIAVDQTAPYWLEVGYAVSPLGVDIAQPEQEEPGRAPLQIALCKRQSYAITLAVVDRADGDVLFRKRASAKRCDKRADEVLPALASALVSGL